MKQPINIPSGAIMNVFLPKKKKSLKRWIMNLESKVVKKRYNFTEELNHTAVIERDGDNILLWEAKVIGGVSATHLDQYSQDAEFIITIPPMWRVGGLSWIKSQSGINYDFKAWFQHLRYIITGKWKGQVQEEQYSKEWFCSELVDRAFQITETPYLSTPNHIYAATKQSEVWRGTYSEFVDQLNSNQIKINE